MRDRRMQKSITASCSRAPHPSLSWAHMANMVTLRAPFAETLRPLDLLGRPVPLQTSPLARTHTRALSLLPSLSFSCLLSLSLVSRDGSQGLSLLQASSLARSCALAHTGNGVHLYTYVYTYHTRRRRCYGTCAISLLLVSLLLVSLLQVSLLLVSLLYA